PSAAPAQIPRPVSSIPQTPAAPVQRNAAPPLVPAAPATIGAKSAAKPVAQLTAQEWGARWQALEIRALGCTACVLASTRINVVFGCGNRKAKVVFVGEGPGQNEDEQGQPFVGNAGQLLNKIIEAMGLRRE